jgi:hypothetical protein
MLNLELLDDAKKKRLELDPVSGEELEALGKEIVAQPPEGANEKIVRNVTNHIRQQIKSQRESL